MINIYILISARADELMDSAEEGVVCKTKKS